jgi:hypothetical protein
MIQHVSTKFIGQIPGADPSDIPLNPKQCDFKGTKYWPRAPWKAIRNRTAKIPVDSPVLKLFMEDEFGNPIPDDTRDELLKDTRGFWSDQVEASKTNLLKCYGDLGFQMRNDFRVALEGRYPWLRLCDGHWKVFQLWINYFPSWEKTHLRQESPIVISDDDSVCSPAGSKRSHEGDEGEATPPKKHKGKGEIFDFHPPKAKSRKGKVTATLARVSNSSSLSVGCVLKTSRRTHCTHFPGVHRMRILTFRHSTGIQISPTVVASPVAQVRLYRVVSCIAFTYKQNRTCR